MVLSRLATLDRFRGLEVIMCSYCGPVFSLSDWLGAGTTFDSTYDR